MSSKRDQMEIDLAETQRKYKLVEDELSHVKGKLLKVQQEKKQMEKDQRATLSLAQTLQGNRHSETDYYKRKVKVPVKVSVSVSWIVTCFSFMNDPNYQGRSNLSRSYLFFPLFFCHCFVILVGSLQNLNLKFKDLRQY